MDSTTSRCGCAPAPGRPLGALPIELNDLQVIDRKQDAADFCDMVVAQFDEMIEQCVRYRW